MGRAPRASGQTGDGSTDGEIEPFDEGGLDAAGEAVAAESLVIGIRFTEQYLMTDYRDPATTVTFDDLRIEQLSADDP